MQNDGSISPARAFFKNKWVKLILALNIISTTIITGTMVFNINVAFSTINKKLTVSSKLSDEHAAMFSQNDTINYNPDECNNNNKTTKGNCVNPTGDNITWIGDSYSENSNNQAAVEAKFPGIYYDGHSGRKFAADDSKWGASGLNIIKNDIKNDLRDYLVFALGTNTDAGTKEAMASNIDDLVNTAKGFNSDVQIVLVSPLTNNDGARATYDAYYEAMKEAASKYSNVVLADWYDTAKDHLNEYFDDHSTSVYTDNSTHPNATGYEKWLETIINALPKNCTGGGAGLLSGSTTREKVWNWFVKANIPGVSDNALVISGLIGNFAAEVGVNPFGWSSLGGTLFGCMRASTCGTIVNDVNSAVGADYFGRSDLENIPEDAIDKAIDVELNFLVNKFAGGSNWKTFVENLDVVSDKTPEAYAELGAVAIENCFGAGYKGEGPLKDSGVIEFAKSSKNPYSASWQSGISQTINERRDEARAVYDKYATATNPGNSAGGSSVNSSGTLNLTTSDSVVNYAGDVVWDKDQLTTIQKNQPIYEAAAKKQNIPWQLLAALHMLEHGLAIDNPSNGQGIYQLYSYTDGGTNSNAFLPAGPVDNDEFKRQTEIAAEIIKNKIDACGHDPYSEKGIKCGLFSFNGRASQYISRALAMGFSQAEADIGEGSPYVMNRYDARRDPNSSEVDPNWSGRFTGDGKYESTATMSGFGGYVLYAALAGLSWSDSTTSNNEVCPEDEDEENTGNGGELIAKTALDLAWPDNNHFYEIKPEYAAAASEVGLGGYGTDLGLAQDCGHFAAVAVLKSGVDPGYPGGFTPKLEEYMSNSDLWEEIPNNQSEGDLQPGDVFVVNAGSSGFGSTTTPSGGAGADGHVYIYVGDGKIAAASLNSWTGKSAENDVVYFTDSRGYNGLYRIFRSTVKADITGGTVGSFDEGLKAIEASEGVQVGAAVTAPGDKDTSNVQVGGSWTGGRAWSTIKVPLSIAAIQKNASSGNVTDPYGGQCSHSLSSAVNLAITQSDNCAAWWLWTALGGDNSSAASNVTNVINSGGDSTTTVTSSGDGSSLTSGKTTWSLVGQAIFMANISSISGSSTVMNEMKTHNAGDGAHGLNTFTAITKGGWGNAGGTSATRQLGIIKLNNGKCSAVAIGTDSGSNFSILDKIAQVLKNHQNDIPSGSCPGGL